MNKLTRSRITLRALLFIAAVALTVYFLPRTDKNHFIYEVNRPWSYALLTAPFDIPVHLDSISTARLKDSINEAFEPVYVRDLAAEKTLISDYTTRLNSADLPDITPAQKNQIIKAVRQVYENGIVDRDTYQRITSGQLPAVRFIHDNVAISVPTSRFLSAYRAYESIDSLVRQSNMRGALSATNLAEILQPNISLDTLTTRRLLDEAYQKATAPVGVIQQGERIIDKGDIVNLRLATILDTYEEMASERSDSKISQHHYPIAGQTLYIVILFTAFYLYLYIFRRSDFFDDRTVIFLMSLLTVFTLVAFAMQATFRSGLYLMPFTIVPILVLTFLDSRTAYFTHIIEILICSIIAAFPTEFIFVEFIAGVVAIDSLKDLTRRSQLIRTAAFIFVAYTLSYLSIEIMQTGSLAKTEPRIYGCFAINSLLISFSYTLMFLLERVFGYTSRVTLVELSDTNNPLLRELSEQCPGTFNHSMAVSNLASAAAQAIGANVQMVRTGALYHDIGKIKNPAFFTENQHGVNPHDALDPIQSARVVTGHITDGIAMAEKAKLPPVIRDFIVQHHGAGKARYFYTTYANAHPGEEIDASLFSYPGPNPQTRETSILMMADAVEAASRSMKENTPEAITALVNKIIDSQIAEGLHNESPLSFRDVKAVKDSFIQRLRTMYHSRISYPELKRNAASEPAAQAPAETAPDTAPDTSGQQN